MTMFQSMESFEEEIVECGWSITAPVGKRIEMNVTSLLAYSANCEEYGDKFNGLAVRFGKETRDNKYVVDLRRFDKFIWCPYQDTMCKD